MKKFGMDIDGTITCPSTFVPYLNEKYNLNITIDDIKQYDFTPLVDVSEAEFGKWFASVEGHIYANSPLAKGAKPILKQWENLFELYFISARNPRHLQLTKDWFVENGLNYRHIELIGSHDKVNIAKQHGVDIFFEDKHDNAVAIYEHCHIPVILFNTPYNQDPVPNGVIRVNNWPEAAQWVDQWLQNNVDL